MLRDGDKGRVLEFPGGAWIWSRHQGAGGLWAPGLCLKWSCEEEPPLQDRQDVGSRMMELQSRDKIVHFSSLVPSEWFQRS